MLIARLLPVGILQLTIQLTSVVVAADESRFAITTKRPDDRVEVKVEKGTATFSIQSPFGISRAIIQRKNEPWPDRMLLRLHLKGMEHILLMNDRIKIEGSIGIQDGKPLVRLWKDGKEDSPLTSKSPFWIDVRILGRDGNPATELPLKDGYFELQLPAAIFEGNPLSITVEWIDFYRT